MIGTIGVVLIITIVLLINVGHRTAVAIAAATETSTPEEQSALEAEIEALRQRMQAEEQDADLMMSRTAARWQVEVARTQRLQDELNRMRDAAESATSPSHVREIMELDAMASQLSSELEQRRRRRQISYLIDDSNSDALVAELMRDRVVTSRTVVEGAPRMRTGEASKLARAIINDYLAAAAKRPTHLLLAVKPSGIRVWQEINALLRTDPALKDLQIGVDLIGENASTTGQFLGTGELP